MCSLYPEILFHFTNKKSLYGILEKDFKVSYSRERIIGRERSTEFASPMVSFCDLKLSELKEHLRKYGHYGIGLSKTWANLKGLNPVFYVNKESPLADSFISELEQLFEILDTSSNYGRLTEPYRNMLDTCRYIKNYEDESKRDKSRTRPNRRFADEWEWRYVPPMNQTEHPLVPLSKIRTIEDKKILNAGISHLKLEFVPEDIKYLVIQSDGERINLIKHLESVKCRYDEKSRRRLESRILTAEQIMNDI